MYQHLDLDSDGKLSLQELYDLEHDKNEMCIKPFLDTCDTDGYGFVQKIKNHRKLIEKINSLTIVILN